MTFKWTEYTIAKAVATQTLEKKCIVLVDNCGWTGHECDVLGITHDMRVIDVEVKISRADLKADAKKDKWWQKSGTGVVQQHTDADGRITRRYVQERELLEHPVKVWKHYYALPKNIWKTDLFDVLPSASSGVLLLDELPSGKIVVSCVRRATPVRDAYKLQPSEVLAVARLANLRMWESYAREDSALAKLKAATTLP